MRPANFDINQMINDLNGSCQSIEEWINSMYEDDFNWMTDLTQAELEELDSEIFQCCECGWWMNQPAEENQYGEWVCTDCYEDK